MLRATSRLAPPSAAAAGRIHIDEGNLRKARPSSATVGRLESTRPNGTNRATGPKISCSRVGSHRTSRIATNPIRASARSREKADWRGAERARLVEFVAANALLLKKLWMLPGGIGCTRAKSGGVICPAPCLIQADR